MAGTTNMFASRGPLWRGPLTAAGLAGLALAALASVNESSAMIGAVDSPASVGFARTAPGELLLAQNAAPLRFDYTYESGSYLRKARGTVQDPAGFAHALAALQPPAGAHGAYGMLGDDALLGKEPGYGLRQLGMLARRYLTFEMIDVRQPPGFEQYGVQSGTFARIEQLNDATLGWVLFDLRGKFEADLRALVPQVMTPPPPSPTPPPPANAANPGDREFVILNVTDDFHVTLLDPATIVTKPDGHRTAKYADIGELDLWIEQGIELDCAGRNWRFTSSISHMGGGDTIDRMRNGVDDTNWAAVKPGTFGEHMFTVICQWPGSKPTGSSIYRAPDFQTAMHRISDRLYQLEEEEKKKK